MTTARARLFKLVEDVLTGRTPRVALSHRGYDEEVVLMRAADVERLEADLAALRARAAPAPRPLRGLGRLTGSAEAVVGAVRARQRALADAKREALTGDPAAPPRAAPRRGGGRGAAG